LVIFEAFLAMSCLPAQALKNGCDITFLVAQLTAPCDA